MRVALPGSSFRVPHLGVKEAPWAFGGVGPLDAAAERLHMTGYVIWADGNNKTFSSSGGKIEFVPSAATFSNAGTTYRIGIQDTSLTTGGPARGDTTFDVYDDLVGGTDTLTAGSWKSVVMSTGSMTVNHLGLYTVVFDCTGRGGADTLSVRCFSLAAAAHQPAVVTDIGASFTAQTNLPNVLLIADDGTLGTFHECYPFLAITELSSFNSGSTPDEYANVFRVPFECQVDALWTEVNTTATSADFELILYSDPLGTPAAQVTATVDANTTAGTAGATDRSIHVPIAPYTLLRDTDYAVAVRPTTANSIALYYVEANAQTHFALHSLGDNCHYATRSNQSGAFSRTLTRRMHTGVTVGAIDDGRGVGRAQMLIGGLH